MTQDIEIGAVYECTKSFHCTMNGDVTVITDGTKITLTKARLRQSSGLYEILVDGRIAIFTTVAGITEFNMYLEKVTL